MISNTLLPATGNAQTCQHHPPASAADLRLDAYKNAHGLKIYELLGGKKKGGGCITAYGDVGKTFAYELGNFLTHQGGKNIVYAQYSPEKQTLGPLNGNPFNPDGLRGQPLILASDCLSPEELKAVDGRLRALKETLGFGEVIYVLER